MELLRCVRLSKSFDGIQALADFTFEFSSGGITAIIGPNGAGKTTLFDVLTGFQRPDFGRCMVGGNEITGLPTFRIAQLGISRTFQEPRLIRRLSVLENVMLARTNQVGERLGRALFRVGVSTQEASNRQSSLRLLQFVGLEDRSTQPAGELSYGQQKLLTLAACLATQAQIILLDEPVAGINASMAARILNLLRELRSEGKQIVFIEHDIRAVREVADTTIVMDHGRIVCDGPPHEVLERPEIVEAYLG